MGERHIHKPPATGLEDLPIIFARTLGIGEFAGKALSDLLVLGYFGAGLIIRPCILKISLKAWLDKICNLDGFVSYNDWYTCQGRSKIGFLDKIRGNNPVVQNIGW